VGVDPLVLGHDTGSAWRETLTAAGLQLVAVDTNLVDAVWGDTRPSLPLAPVAFHPLCYSGKPVAQVCVCPGAPWLRVQGPLWLGGPSRPKKKRESFATISLRGRGSLSPCWMEEVEAVKATKREGRHQLPCNCGGSFLTHSHSLAGLRLRKSRCAWTSSSPRRRIDWCCPRSTTWRGCST
jgi:hypothetical protein